jgi:N-acetylglucosaminyldiphosphoundecaprenol N-acetyl-beta-D-mannosaminyltransferase
VDEIAAAAPDVVWVGLGLPKQDEWMHQHAAELHPAVVLGVGAAFEFEADTKRRAPQWMQRCGLEWLHRLASEPRRLARRYATTNTEFVIRASVVLAGLWVRRLAAWGAARVAHRASGFRPISPICRLFTGVYRTAERFLSAPSEAAA